MSNPEIELWRPMAVLPNLDLSDPIEAGEAAFLPLEDARTLAVGAAHPRFRTFTRRFTDAFGQRVLPTILALSPDADDSYRTAEALAGLRDALSLSVVPFAWAHELMAPHQHRTLYSDAFAFYPWMIDRHYEHLIADTPGVLAVHLVEEFRGQSAPAVAPVRLRWTDVDQSLLRGLTEAWRRRYCGSRPSWRDTALFRSLNMANQACRLPAGRDASVYDVGRHIALWVSAFEILAHPGPEGRSDLGRVVSLIEMAPWRAPTMRARRYTVFKARGGGAARKSGFASHVYGRLYDLRNAFLHGNPISRARLFSSAGKPWWAYAAPLYRTALIAFLTADRISPALPSEPIALGSAIAARLADEHPAFERAILTARRT